ncbi:MAG TPA: hypothetical protein VGL87_14450 [Steroidobacteraceae bacterium]
MSSRESRRVEQKSVLADHLAAVPAQIDQHADQRLAKTSTQFTQCFGYGGAPIEIPFKFHEH